LVPTHPQGCGCGIDAGKQHCSFSTQERRTHVTCLSHFTLTNYAIMEEHIGKIQDQLKEAAKILYGNPRISKVTISVETLMGASISHLSSGDCDSPECQVAMRKKNVLNDAICKYRRPTASYQKPAERPPENLQRGLQQWV